MTGRSTMVNVGKSTANKQQQEDNVYGGKKKNHTQSKQKQHCTSGQNASTSRKTQNSKKVDGGKKHTRQTRITENVVTLQKDNVHGGKKKNYTQSKQEQHCKSDQKASTARKTQNEQIQHDM